MRSPVSVPVPARAHERLRRCGRRFGIAATLVASLLFFQRAASADETLTFDGTVTDEAPDHLFIDFQVPAGTAEIEVRHAAVDRDDILDWGLYDPNGTRGWGGGNDEPAIVTEEAASRSYLAGPISPGTWRVVIGKAKLVGGTADYHVEVLLKDVATLEPQPEREPYEDPGALVSEARWYAGDFHVHSRESGDARPSFDEIVALAKDRGLDFVELSDHNTTSQLDFLNATQTGAAEGPSPLLLLPGVEYTTYAGHANGIGATAFVDHKIGLPGVTIDAALDAFEAQGALFSINHPALDLGDACIGCAWDHDVDGSKIGAVEIATAGSTGLFFESTMAFWEGLCAQGHRVAAIGGSDDHRAGVDLGAFGTPLGSPATMVYASELSVSGILDGVRSGRTVVKVRGPDDPMVELDMREGGDTGAIMAARVTGGAAMQARWVVNGAPGSYIDIPTDDEELILEVAAPVEGTSDRYRLEVWEGTVPVTLTSHVWVEPEDVPAPPPVIGGIEPRGGGGCSTSRGATAPVGWLALAAALWVTSRSTSRRRGERR